MRLILSFSLCLLGLILFSQELPEIHPSHLIVKFIERPAEEDLFSNNALARILLEAKVESTKKFANRKIAKSYVFYSSHFEDINLSRKTLIESGLFQYVEYDYRGKAAGVLSTIPDDTFFSSRQWGLLNDGSFTGSTATADADIDMELAWDLETGSPDIIIATLDSGLNDEHPEFTGRIWQNPLEIDNGTDSDGNGYVSDLIGWDFTTDDNIPSDDHGHGTNVTSIMGANGNNSLGFAGVNWNSKLMTCRILDDNGFGYYSWWTDAIYYAVDNGARVINMSVGGNSYSASMEEAVNYAHANDVIIVACMMNTDSELQHYPARYGNLIAVGATSPNDERTSPFPWSSSSGSSYGTHIDFCAPGNFIYGVHNTNDSNYNSYWSGTSQASPHVAGLVSLLLSQNPNLDFDQVYQILKNSSEDEVGKSSEDKKGWDKYHGHGRINAFEALNQLVALENIEDLNYPVIYPNPALDICFIKTNNLFIEEVVLFNAAGQSLTNLISYEIGPNGIEIDISELADGIFFIKLLSGEKEVASLQALKSSK